jgi:hypothetical protein
MLKRRVGTYYCGHKGGGYVTGHVTVKAWRKKCFQIFEWRCDGWLVTMGIGQSSHHVSM